MKTNRYLLRLVVCLLLAFTTAVWAQEVTFWSAPNPPQTEFWEQMAEAYQEVNPDVNITVTPIPESPSSEAAILASLAGGTAPTISENIFIGFGAQLQNAEAILPLNEMPGWEELLEQRQMETAIQTWTFPDGNYYILPIYTNPMLFGWRIDILNELGYEEPPTTYSGIIEVCEALKDQYPNKFLMARPDLVSNVWWQRWFDFFILYYAASQGQPFLTGSEVTADDEAAIGVFDFYRQLMERDCILTREATNPFEQGNSIWLELGPWTFPYWEENFPEFTRGEEYVLSAPPVPDDYPEGQPIYTFADAKGLVFYRQASDEETQAAWDFVTWVFSQPEHDLQWLQATNLPPTRDDLTENPIFDPFFEENPALVPYAQALPYAVPPIVAEEFSDIQTVLSDEGLVPAIQGEKTPEQAWQDAEAAIAEIIGE